MKYFLTLLSCLFLSVGMVYSQEITVTLDNGKKVIYLPQLSPDVASGNK